MSIVRCSLMSFVTLLGLTVSISMLRGADPLPAAESSAPHFLAYLSTDKQIYRQGEKVYFRSVILNAVDHRPMADNQAVFATLQVKGPKGEVLFNTAAQSELSVAGLAWAVPAGTAGGQYKAIISFPASGFPPAERKFEIRAYRAPRLKGEIVFLRDGYGRGETVKASLHVERAEGGLPAGAAVTTTALVDGAVAYDGKTRIDAAGNCAVEFALPPQIQKGDGTLSLAITDGGVVEPIVKTIPILIHSVDVQFYPEGGDLIAGLVNRVYLEARLPSQKPADLTGQIVDSHGKVVADVKTEHEGRGRVTFIPTANEAYSLKLSQPLGIDRLFQLPPVKPAGVTIASNQDVYPSGKAIKLMVASTTAGEFKISLSKHQAEVASVAVTLAADQPQEISLTPPGQSDGVLIATVTDKIKNSPVAERLVFRQSESSIHVSIKADRPSYCPADVATLTVTTTDDQGKPISAVVGITVSDESILQMIEKRERAPRLTSMVMLETDVRELGDADLYLDPADPRAPLATDLLLGTQGWRRFATMDAAKFMLAQGDAARRVIADLRPAPPEPETFAAGAANRPHRMVAFAPASAPPGVKNGNQPIDDLDEAVRDKEPQALKALKRDDFDLDDRAPKDELAQDVAKHPQGGRKRDLQRQFRSMPAPIAVRIYAHDLTVSHRPQERSDFTETLFWSAGIRTDASGTATAKFTLNDSVTSFAATADAFTSDGTLGQAEATIVSIQPFYVEPKLPLEVSSGDIIHLPISFVNGTTTDMPVVNIITESAAGIEVAKTSDFSLAAGARQRQVVDVTIGPMPQSKDLVIHAQAGSYHDDITRHLVALPTGFPIEFSKGGLLAANGTFSRDLEIPKTLVPGSIVTTAALYPTPMGNLTEALKRLMQEPNGCFEQTTSTNYPLVMADQYLVSHTGVDPAIISQTAALLDKGYERLVGFECKGKGFEWFGEDPGHECLSAYGLLEFTDMGKVRSVDAAMLKNTRDWLLSRRDGKGGYSHERRSLHTWVTDPNCANSYCTWALFECGEKNLDKEVAWVKEHAATDPNTYVTALAANVMFLAGDKEAAKGFMDKLVKQQSKDGHILGAVTTVVGSEGDSLQVETTSLATLAWLRDDSYTANVESAIHFLADSCKGGRYGSTQSTVLALRAIVAYDKARAHPTAPGKVLLIVDDEPVGTAIDFDEHSQGAIKLPDFSGRLIPGKHTIAVKMIDGSALPFALAVNYNSIVPASSDACKLHMTTKLRDARTTEGAITQADVTVTNTTDQTVPTPIAIVGLPGGLEVRYDQLKELVKADRIAAYEVRGREVVLYWRDMQPRESVQIPLSVIAAIPGIYTGPASRAYLYYADENKQWSDGMKISIDAK